MHYTLDRCYFGERQFSVPVCGNQLTVDYKEHNNNSAVVVSVCENWQMA